MEESEVNHPLDYLIECEIPAIAEQCERVTTRLEDGVSPPLDEAAVLIGQLATIVHQLAEYVKARGEAEK